VRGRENKGPREGERYGWRERESREGDGKRDIVLHTQTHTHTHTQR